MQRCALMGGNLVCGKRACLKGQDGGKWTPASWQTTVAFT